MPPRDCLDEVLLTVGTTAAAVLSLVAYYLMH